MYTSTNTRTYHLIAHTLSETRNDIVVARKEALLEMPHQKTTNSHPPTHNHTTKHTYHSTAHIPSEKTVNLWVIERWLCAKVVTPTHAHTQAHAHILTPTHAHTQAHAHILTHLHIRTTWQRTY